MVHSVSRPEVGQASAKKSASTCSGGHGEKSNSVERWWAGDTLLPPPTPRQLGLMDPTGRLSPAHGRAGLSQKGDLLCVQSQPLQAGPDPRPLLSTQLLPHSTLHPRQRAVVAAPRDKAPHLLTITVPPGGKALLSRTPAWFMSPCSPPGLPCHITHSCLLVYLPYPSACKPLQRPLT